jgi:hypothetical protein
MRARFRSPGPRLRSQEYTFKASAPPGGGEPGGKAATFARARVDLARYAVAGGTGEAFVVDVPLQLAKRVASAGAQPPLLRITVQATWLTRVDDDDAWSDVSELSTRAFGCLRHLFRPYALTPRAPATRSWRERRRGGAAGE